MQLLQIPSTTPSSSIAEHSTSSLGTYQSTPISPMARTDAFLTHSVQDLCTETTRIYAGKLFDSEAQELLPNRVITIDTDSGLILSVDGFDPEDVPSEESEKFIDLSDATVLPGLVDTHVHCGCRPS